MRKVALISEHASPLAVAGGVDSGGQNVYVAEVALELARRGCLVDVFTRRDDPEQPERLQWARGVRVIHVPAGPAHFVPKEQLLLWMDAFGDFLLEFCEAQSLPYDIIHANFFMSGWAAMRASRMLGVPLVTTFHALGKVRRQHQQQDDGFPDVRFAIEEELCWSSDRIIAECAQEKDDLIRLYGAHPEHIDIVPCGVDPRALRPLSRMECRASLGWEPRAFTLLHVGRIVRRKGVDTVIQALGHLRAQLGIDARLVIVGGACRDAEDDLSPEMCRLRSIALEAGVAAHVEFAGHRDRNELAQYYSAADVFVTTPWYEPFGMTVIEAMACGLPVVGARVGGIRSSVRDGLTGLLVPARNPVALAEALRGLYHDTELRLCMGVAGRRRVVGQFTWQHVADGLMRSYAQARQDLSSPAAPAFLAASRLCATAANSQAELLAGRGRGMATSIRRATHG